jgi:hypothetical protein
VDPVILGSARKHGVHDDDMLHAYRNPIRAFDLDDLTMLIGPDMAARLLERLVLLRPRGSISSFMPCPLATNS